MNFSERVRKVLEGLEVDDPEVSILDTRGSKVLASVVSPSFAAMNEAERQALVWGRLIDELGDYDSRWVEFVYTDTPTEAAEAAKVATES